MNSNYLQNIIINQSIRGPFVAVEFSDVNVETGLVQIFRSVNAMKLKNNRRDILENCMWNMEIDGPRPASHMGPGTNVRTTCRTNVIIRDPSTGKFLSYKKLVAAGYDQFDLSLIPSFPVSN
jgi:hypothetical protein